LPLLFPVLHARHNYRNRGYHAHGCNDPGDDLDDLDLVAQTQSAGDLALELVKTVRDAVVLTFDILPDLEDKDAGYDPKDSRDDEEDCMHRVEQFLRSTTMEADIKRRQENCPGATEYQEAHPGLFGPRPPFMLGLQVDEGIDCKDQLGDRESEHYTKQDRDIPRHSTPVVALRARLLMLPCRSVKHFGDYC